jgi:hypothetical protein
MKVIQPKGIRLDAKPLPNGNLFVTYEEDFDDAEIVERTVKLMSALAPGNTGLVVTAPTPKTIRIVAADFTLERLSNLMVSEFMQWAALGRAPLSEVILAYGMVSSQQPKPA